MIILKIFQASQICGFFLCHKGTTIHRTLIFLVCWHTMLDTVYTVIHRCRTSYIHCIIDVRRCSIPFNIVTFIKIFVIVYIKIDYFYKNDMVLNTDRTVSNIVYTVSGLVYTVLDGDISMLDAHHTVSNNSKYLILNSKY